ncbi:MAG: hypothetical protein A3J83_04560 [Elusimicrobia bacterium RIFOXYA2_FULL_40_6]|nr:MAG: hypothetical protein A3J83_04560 [Elusimicrobia bacterium RIFOXYA2_FULL_40_6]
MTERERYLETMLFGNPDKVPFMPGSARESTIKNWNMQGLPEGKNYIDFVREKLGIEPLKKIEKADIWVEERMNPMFEEKVIEKKERSQIVQDWKGNICEISNDFDVRYLRDAIDFVTRSWLKCPVENRNDWEAMKLRYNPNDPSRFPENIKEEGKKAQNRDYVLSLEFSGPFWQLREWLGFEKLCMLFIEDPDFVKDMVNFWKDYVSALLEKIVPHVKLDFVHISEDMAYKEKAMISPAMAREFLSPCYSQWNEIIKGSGCPVYGVDSDGYIAELIPVWIECGINECDPMEVAAGCDVNQLRKMFGKKMAFKGGVDKRAMAKGGKIIQEEIKRLAPVIKDGGYIPSCDHGIPNDVNWKDFMEYCELLAKSTGWK